jgi:uridylate kinase
MRFKRVLLKLSGETLSDDKYPISENSLLSAAEEIKFAVDGEDLELAIVVGAGNLWRGEGKFIERTSADKMGMLATAMNSLALSCALNKVGLKTKIFSAFGVCSFIENFDKFTALQALKEKHIVVFAGGTGNPFFTTDTTAALRAAEIEAGVVLKATQVDGIYNADPHKVQNAVKFDKLTYQEALNKKLNIMDAEAFSLCMKTKVSIVVFDFYKKGNLAKVLNGEKIGTTVEE